MGKTKQRKRDLEKDPTEERGEEDPRITRKGNPQTESVSQAIGNQTTKERGEKQGLLAGFWLEQLVAELVRR